MRFVFECVVAGAGVTAYQPMHKVCVSMSARVCIDIGTCVEYIDIATIDRAILVQIQNAKRDLVFVLLLLLLCD